MPITETVYTNRPIVRHRLDLPSLFKLFRPTPKSSKSWAVDWSPTFPTLLLSFLFWYLCCCRDTICPKLGCPLVKKTYDTSRDTLASLLVQQATINGLSPGLVVIGCYSYSSNHEFESQRCILHLFDVKCIAIWKRPKINQKESREGLFLKSNDNFSVMLSNKMLLRMI